MRFRSKRRSMVSALPSQGKLVILGDSGTGGVVVVDDDVLPDDLLANILVRLPATTDVNCHY
jgi:hypothetical protein